MEKDFVKLNNLNVAYRHYPSESKSVFLILHGWGGSSDSWKQVGEMIAKLGYNVYIPDFPGFGDTKMDQAYDLDAFAGLIEEFVDKLNLGELTLLGHSNGGKVSIRLATRGKLKIKKLILNNAAAIRPQLSFFKKMLRVLSKIKFILKIIPCYHCIRKLGYQSIGGHDYINCADENQKKTFQNMLETDVRDELGNIKSETVLIWGDKDTYTPLKYGKMIHELIPGSKLIILDGEKHGIHLQNPNRLVETVRENG